MKIAKIVNGVEVELFSSQTKAAEDIGMTKHKFNRLFRKHGIVKDGYGNLYVQPRKVI